METYAYHLQFTSPLHIGVEGIGQEKVEAEIPSDTLWGALVQCWNLLWEEDFEDLVCRCPFEVSSAFPFKKNWRFYPAPVNFLDKCQELLAEEQLEFKKLKRIRYLREDILLALSHGQRDALAAVKENYSHHPDIWGGDLPQRGWAVCRDEQRPRLRIDRLTGGSEKGGFFYCSDIYFPPDGGLFFLARVQSDELIRFEAALRLLGDQGVGADRSIGRGRFVFTRHNLPDEMTMVSQGDGLLLSICLPSAEDIATGALQKSQVRLKVRRGHAGAKAVSGLRRPDLLSLGEGSVLTGRINGQIALVIRRQNGAAHDVYRYGRAFTIPWYDTGGGSA